MKARADRRLRAALRACLATVLVGAGAGDAGALTLGEIELRSALGEALDARIPVIDEGGDTLRGACFSLARAPDRGIPQVPDATLELRRHARGAELLVRSRAPVVEPAVGLGIDIACPGAQAAVRADFPILLEPRAAKAGGAKIDATSLGSLPGDSLANVAAKIFPADRAARDAYLRAMREANPSLATLADDEALPAGTAVALPDLHAFARAQRAAPAKVAAAGPPARRIERARAPEPSEPPAPPARPAAPPPRAKRDVARAAFELRLSAPVLDLSPSRTMTEEQRARLRERLLVLEADDRTASMLELRESIRKLESQVAALELKLAQTPAAMPPAPKAAPATKSVEPGSTPAASTPAPAAAPAPAPQKPAVAERPAPAPEPAPPRPKPAPQRPKVHANPRPASAAAWYDAPWVLPGALAIVVIALAALLVRRRRPAAPPHEFADTPDLIVDEAPADQTVIADVASDEPPAAFDRTARFEAPAQGAPAIAPEAATRIPEEDSAELRRRYIEERFPEIANGALVLDDPASVVKAARLLYEDGAAARAVELLQFAIEQDPGEPSIWLALFEILRIERLRGEFGQLALRFHDRHGSSPEWPRVQRAGREIDPGNAFYGESDGQRFDAAAENWLQVPAATGDALAAELRGALMEGASVSERDLAPDPTPALRKAESIRLA